jgi:hypothetical protein
VTLVGWLALLSSAAGAATLDREPLIAVSSPSAHVLVPPGQTSVTVHLEVSFGSLSNGAAADPTTFKPTLTTIPAKTLLPLFTDVKDGSGNVIGKRADVVLPYTAATQKFTFVARVKSVPFPVGPALKRLSDADRVAFQLRHDFPPTVQNLHVVNPIGFTSDGTPRINIGQGVSFAASFSDPDGDRVLGYRIDFGDGASNVVQAATGVTTLNETHTYDGSQREYMVTVSASDWAATTIQSLTVRANAPPVAKLRLSPSEGSFSYPTHMDGVDSTDEDGDALSYSWDFGDGTTQAASSSPTATHVYPPAGVTKRTYTVKLTARDVGGLASTAQADLVVRAGFTGETMLNVLSPQLNGTVQVSGTLPVDIAVDRATCGAAIDFATFTAHLNNRDVTTYFSPVTDAARGGEIVGIHGEVPLSYVNMATTNAMSVNVSSQPFTKTGSNVPTTVHDSDQVTRFRVSSNKKPLAAFTVNPPSVLTGEPVSFDASSSHDPENAALTYVWNFGDGSPALTSSSPFATHSYAVQGLYGVSLAVSDGTWTVAAAPATVLVAPIVDPGGNPKLGVSTSSIDFGDVTNAPIFAFNFLAPEPGRILSLTNTGDGVLTFSSVSLASNDGTFTIVPPVPGAPIATPSLQAGESHALVLTFIPPRTAAPGTTFSDTLTVQTNAGQATIALHGRVVAAPGAAVELITHPSGIYPPLVDFGPRYTTGSTRWLAIGNQGSVDAVVTGIDLTGADADQGYFTANLPAPVVVHPGDSYPFQVQDTYGIEITFNPQAVTATRRFSALMTVHWSAVTTSGLVPGDSLEVALEGVASYVGLVSFDNPNFEFERVGRNIVSDMLGSDADGLSPAQFTATYLAGQRDVTLQLGITPIYPPGNTAFTAPLTTATLNAAQPLVTFPIQLKGPNPGHYSALLTVQAPTNPSIPPMRYLLHGYVKGDDTIGVLGTTETLYFADDSNYDGTPIVELDAKGHHAPHGADGIADLSNINDPFEVAATPLEFDQWTDEPSDLSIVGGTVYSIDSDVLDNGYAPNVPGLTQDAYQRLAGGGQIGTGGILQNGAFLSGVGPGGDPDLSDASGDTLDMDATPDGVLFFTETFAAGPAFVTQVDAYVPASGVKTILTTDVSTLLAGVGGRTVQELRAIKLATGYRLFVVLYRDDGQDTPDDYTLYEADVDLNATVKVTTSRALSPSSVPDPGMVLDAAGNWLTATDDGHGLLQVYRESLHAGAASRAIAGQVQLPLPDPALSLWVDRLGNVLVDTENGIYKFAAGSNGSLTPAGYVVSGSTFFTDTPRGSDPDAKSAEVDLVGFQSWFGK